METTCYRCGYPVEGQSSFCPSCGAPQVRVSVPRPQVPEPQELAAPPPPPAPIALLRVGQGNQIDWKRFLRIAVPLAALVGFFTARRSPLGWLILLPAGVILAVRLYHRRRPGPLRARHGAKLGSFIGLLSFGFFLIFFAVDFGTGAYHRVMEDAIRETVARNPSPQSQQLAQLWASGTQGVVTITLFLLVFALVFLLAIGAAFGALAAPLSRDKSSP